MTTQVTPDEIVEVLQWTFNDANDWILYPKDNSNKCGQRFIVTIVSDKFYGMKTLDRHKYVNHALASIWERIHALTQKTLTHAEYNDLVARGLM
ncbi:bola-like protein [Schizopora paradoxa]|uniref:Bola-like protein n=1 Tax=Schizopora paradoxa TaxID=27342 RepID=A0A0H2RDB6_9AGAM|nr:bola-like protein [Schizopora paradoxa]